MTVTTPEETLIDLKVYPISRRNIGGRLSADYRQILAQVLQHMPCEVMVISPHYEIVMANREFTRLTGCRETEIIGKKCYEVFGSGQPCAKCPAKRAMITKTVHRNTQRQFAINKKVLYVQQQAIPILNRAGTVECVIEISRDITPSIKIRQKNHKIFMETVASLTRLIDSRDHSTGEHSAKMRVFAMEIGKEMDLSPATIEEISVAAILHDIGKIGVPEKILKKPGKLMQHEYHLIQRHSQIGYDALVNISALNKVAEYILYHHECYDGSGYPAKKRGEEIPLVSRILSVADVYEAITADRVYRPAMSREQAIRIMAEGRGTKFDPAVLDAFLRILARRGLPVKRPLAKFPRG